MDIVQGGHHHLPSKGNIYTNLDFTNSPPGGY